MPTWRRLAYVVKYVSGLKLPLSLRLRGTALVYPPPLPHIPQHPKINIKLERESGKREERACDPGLTGSRHIYSTDQTVCLHAISQGCIALYSSRWVAHRPPFPHLDQVLFCLFATAFIRTASHEELEERRRKKFTRGLYP